jgi:hypothetical protein
VNYIADLETPTERRGYNAAPACVLYSFLDLRRHFVSTARL